MHGLLTYVVVVGIRREKALGRLTPDPATGPAFYNLQTTHTRRRRVDLLIWSCAVMILLVCEFTVIGTYGQSPFGGESGLQNVVQRMSPGGSVYHISHIE